MPKPTVRIFADVILAVFYASTVLPLLLSFVAISDLYAACKRAR